MLTLVPNEIYKYDNEWIVKLKDTSGVYYQEYIHAPSEKFNTDGGSMRLELDLITKASEDEKRWLERCMSIGKSVSFEALYSHHYIETSKAGLIEVAGGIGDLTWTGGVEEILDLLPDSEEIIQTGFYIEGILTLGDLKKHIKEHKLATV